jgi:Cu+-exporting ATPase
MKYGLLLALLSLNVSAYACPMADAAAYKADVQKVETAVGSQTAYVVKGMTCGSCSEKVNKAILGIDGVLASAVDYQTGEARIAFDDKKTNEDAILAVIQNTGFKAKKVKGES